MYKEKEIWRQTERERETHTEKKETKRQRRQTDTDIFYVEPCSPLVTGHLFT